MRKQTQSTPQRLLEQQSARYVDESELPFTMPPTPPAVDADLLVAGPVFDGDPPAPAGPGDVGVPRALL